MSSKEVKKGKEVKTFSSVSCATRENLVCSVGRSLLFNFINKTITLLSDENVGRSQGNRTHANGFGDRCTTIIRGSCEGENMSTQGLY